MSTSMLAEFGVRLVCGLALALISISWRTVPLAFFRTQSLVMLGLLVLAILDESRLGGSQLSRGILLLAAMMSFAASIVWGLGLPKLGLPATILIVILTGGLLCLPTASSSGEFAIVQTGGRWASALLLGATLTAMLLGHHYLTAPAMSITPLRRLVILMAGALGLRSVLALAGLGLLYSGYVPTHSPGSLSPLFLGMRWGMGILGPAVAIVLTWNTVRIRSTQSATGILYIAMTLVLFGELTSLVLSRESGVLM